ncbi:MAG: hypothetical protein K6G61_01400 [Solobacterium sp.]|nr:hypothetical protein [Solobacterium sp.]
MKTEVVIRNDILTVLIGDHITDMDSSVLCIYDFDWNRYLSPWKHEKVFAKGEAFAGEADLFLEEVLGLIPEGDWKEIIIAGYSLAGLFALYACTKSSVFTACMCASGSLWFKGFTEYLKENPVRCRRVYMSLGDREKDTKNPVMGKVEANTLEAVHDMETYTSVYFEMNPGGHFSEPERRIRKGIRYLHLH